MTANLNDLLVPPSTGWRPTEMTKEHYLFDEFYIEDEFVGQVEAFRADGPFYANCMDTTGGRARSGACMTLARAREFVEEKTGYRMKRP